MNTEECSIYEENWGNVAVLIQKDTENAMDETCEQRGCFKEKRKKKDNLVQNHQQFMGHIMGH